MMLTVKLYEEDENVFDNVEDAIKYMYETNFSRDIEIYDISSDKAFSKTKKIYEEIKKYNKGKLLNEQILPSNPYGYRGIKGCLGVQCYSIMLGTYERNHNCIALFSGHNSDVLDTSTESADLTPSLKALSSLAMLGRFI